MTSLLNSLMRARPADEKTWRAIYDHYLPRVFHFMCYKVGQVQVAEDLTATTFEKAWRNKSQFRRSKGTVQSWLFGIARHVVADYYRKPHREESTDEPLKPSSRLTAVEDTVQKGQDFENVYRIIATFTEQHQEIIALKYGAGLTNRKIAAMTGLSETNVGTILYRLVRKIREELGVEHE
jgi:RNA polymerase sigma-70 factor (ECF subfamily)